MYWYSAKRAGAKRACPNKAMAHIWFMHDARLGPAFLLLDILAEYTLLSMIIMVTPCLWYVVGMKLVCPMSSFLKPLLHAPLLANAECTKESSWNFTRKRKSHKHKIKKIQGARHNRRPSLGPLNCRSFKGATRLGATRPATLRGKWHSESVSERAFEKPFSLKTSQNL